MKYQLLGAAIALIGCVVIGMNAPTWVLVGVLLILWGNNIQRNERQDRFDEHISCKVSENEHHIATIAAWIAAQQRNDNEV